MLDLIEGVSLLLFGLLLCYIGIWQYQGVASWRGWLGRLFLVVWGATLIAVVLVDVMDWLATVSVCVRCGK